MRLRFWKAKDLPPLPTPDAPGDAKWQKDERGYYHRLLPLHPGELGLEGLGGVYVVWHRGLHPKWIYVGATDDLAQAINDARDRTEFLAFEAFGGVYVAWSQIRPEYRDGVRAYLNNLLSPEIVESFPADRSVGKAEPIAVFPPN